MTEQKFDLIILGGGIIGFTAAILAENAGFSVALVEANKPVLDWKSEEYDLRVSAITVASEKIFQSMGVWDKMVDERVTPFQKMEVWDALGFGEINFDAKEVSSIHLGHIIENRVIIKALWQKASTLENIHFFMNEKSDALWQDKEKVNLKLISEKILQAQLIIGSDGARSWLREYLNLECQQWDYEQTALTATVTTEFNHQNTARQRFLPEGPLAFLPLKDENTCSIVWTNSPEKSMQLFNLDDKHFCEAASQALDYRLGKVQAVVDRKHFPLKMIRAKQVVAERVALIGDAAHVIHPLAGQGLNMGILGAACLIKILKEAKNKTSQKQPFDAYGTELNNQDLGSLALLRAYERARKGHTLMMIGLMEFFKQLFSTQSSSLITIRSLGLNWVNQFSPLKKEIMKQAMGLN